MIPLAGVVLSLALQSGAPSLADAYYAFFQGRILESKGDLPGAIAAYKHATELEPSSSAIHAELAGVYARAGRAGEAVAEGEAALKLNKDDHEAHRILGLVQGAIAEGQPEGAARTQLMTQAIGHLEQALVGGRDPGAEITLGRLDVATNRLDKAINVLTNFLFDNPGVPEGVTLLAEAYERTGKIDEAIGTLQPLAESTEGAATGRLALAQLYERANRWIDAARMWAALAATTPADPAYKVQQASALLSGGQAKAGRDLLLEASKIKPRDVSILYLLAQAERRADNPAGAVAASTAISAIDPTDPRGPLAMVEAKEATRDFAGIVMVLKPLYDAHVAANKKDDDVLGFIAMSLANAYESLADYDRAERVLRDLIDRDPANDVAMNALGYMLADHGMKLDEASTLITRALAVDPANWSYLDSLGWTYFKQGKFADAIVPLESASRISATSSLVLDHLGESYFAAKRYKDAADAWSRALAGDGDSIDKVAVAKKRDKARDLIK